LADIEGKVIGINTLISGLNRGLGFAIPINMVKEIAAQLIAAGEVIRPWLGISIEGIGDSEQLRRQFASLEEGVVVQAIFFDTPASASELQAGDVILQVDGRPVKRAGDVQQAVLSRAVGDTVVLDIWRGGNTRSVSIKAGRQPSDLRTATRPPPLLPGLDLDTPAPSIPNLPTTPPALPSSVAGLGLAVRPADPALLKDWGITDRTAGLLVVSIESGSVGEASGLEQGNVILEAANQPITSVAELEKIIQETDLSRGLMLSLAREGARTFAIIKP
jgi:S1-C subfamily serine protease